MVKKMFFAINKIILAGVIIMLSGIRYLVFQTNK